MAMSIKDFVEYMRFDCTPYHTPCLNSNHGMGKSSVIKTLVRAALAEKHGLDPSEVKVIDKRASQLDVSDLTGGIFNVGGQTYNAPPYWLPIHEEDQAWLKDRLEAAGMTFVPFQNAPLTILFLDEIIRGLMPVQQGFFELINDHALHGIRVPDNCYIISAINGNRDLYHSFNQDPAFTDRLIMLDFAPTLEEFFDHLDKQVEKGLVHPVMPIFLRSFPDKIDPDDDLIQENALKGAKGYCRRAWTRLGESLMEGHRNGRDRVEMAVQTGEHLPLVKLSQGYVGLGVCEQFASWVASEFKVLSPSEILDKFSEATAAKLKAMIKKNGVSVAGLSDALVAELAKRPAKLPNKVHANILQYLEIIPREAVVGFWQSWGKKSDSCRAQSKDFNTTPRRTSLLTRSTMPAEAYANWEASIRKTNPGINLDSDSPIPIK